MTRRNRRDRPRPRRKKNKMVQKGRAQSSKRMLARKLKLAPFASGMAVYDDDEEFEGGSGVFLMTDFIPDGAPGSPYRREA